VTAVFPTRSYWDKAIFFVDGGNSIRRLCKTIWARSF